MNRYYHLYGDFLLLFCTFLIVFYMLFCFLKLQKLYFFYKIRPKCVLFQPNLPCLVNDN